jgi:hypothetical protein
MKGDMQNRLSFEPRYHELNVRPTETFWAAIEDPCFPVVKDERERIEAEGARVSWDAQIQLNKFRTAASLPYCLAVIAVIAEALDLARAWPLVWQVVTGIVVLALILGVSAIYERKMDRDYPRKP